MKPFRQGFQACYLRYALEDAIDELVDDIRFYSDELVSRYHRVPNHEGNALIVYLSQSVDDDALANWLASEAHKQLQ